jgi:hypothetical protein
MKKKKAYFNLTFYRLILSAGYLTFFTLNLQGQNITEYAITEINNISYYNDELLDTDLTQINLIIPEGVENPPVFMWIGGGAWA